MVFTFGEDGKYIRLAVFLVRITSNWLQTLSMSHTYSILNDFYGVMIMKKKYRSGSNRHQRCNILGQRRA